LCFPCRIFKPERTDGTQHWQGEQEGRSARRLRVAALKKRHLPLISQANIRPVTPAVAGSNPVAPAEDFNELRNADVRILPGRRPNLTIRLPVSNPLARRRGYRAPASSSKSLGALSGVKGHDRRSAGRARRHLFVPWDVPRRRILERLAVYRSREERARWGWASPSTRGSDPRGASRSGPAHYAKPQVAVGP
jgi:hypothetical protein